MTRALVMGAEGNVGTRLSVHLREDGYDVLEVDIRPGSRSGYVMADINHPIDLLPAFDWEPDVVFVLSAMGSRVTCEQASGLAVSTHLGGINKVHHLCRGGGVMGEALAVPWPKSRYVLSKLLGEKLADYEVRRYGLRAGALRPFMS